MPHPLAVVWPVLTDPDDEALVQLAVESRAEYLVTHNVRHLRAAETIGVRVVTPGAFLSRLKP
jgi:predicted nucleic acid-binding protein